MLPPLLRRRSTCFEVPSDSEATNRSSRTDWLTCVLVFAMSSLLVGLVGCGKRSNDSSGEFIKNESNNGLQVLDDQASEATIEPSRPTEMPANANSDGESIADLLDQAEQAYFSDDLELSQKVLRQIILKHPHHGKALFLYARIVAESGDLESAVELVSGISEQDSDFGLASVGQAAQWLAELGKPDEARTRYRRALEMAPDVAFLRHQFVAFLKFVGWRYEARDVLLPLVATGEASEAELRDLLNVAVGDSKTNPADFFATGPLNQALARLESRSPRDALEVLSSAIDRGVVTFDPAIASVLASCHAELQQFEELELLLANAGSGIQRFPHYWRAIGDQLTHQGETRKSVAAYLRAIQCDPTNEIAYERATAAMLTLGQKELAKTFDERRELLAINRYWARQIGSGQPDELAAATALGKNWESAGHPSLAAAWLDVVLKRHAEAPGIDELRLQVKRLRGLSDESQQSLRLCGLSLDDYPLKWKSDSTRPPAIESSIQAKQNSGVNADANFANANFVDVAQSRGLRHTYRNASQPRRKNFQIYQALGAGVASLDFDLDGYPDFYCGQAGVDLPDEIAAESNLLFRNLQGQFKQVTERSATTDYHFTNCVTAGDVNQDGWADLVIGNLGFNRLLINQGDGTFQEQSSQNGWREDGQFHYTMGLAVADLSGDAHPEIVEMNYVNDPTMYAPLARGEDGDLLKIAAPIHYTAESDQVWMNDSKGRFTAIVLGDPQSDSEGIGAASFGNTARPGLGLIVTDLDDERGNEIFVANDGRPNQLWRVDRQRVELHAHQLTSNQINDVAVSRGFAVSARGESAACMGVAIADFDGNQTPDLMITNWFDEWINLYLTRSDGTCRDVAPQFGLDRLSEGRLGFGCQAIDYDNDALVDVFIANGHIDNEKGADQALGMPAQILANRGDRFELAKQTDPAFWEMDHLGRCAITSDYNRDGRLDLVVVDLVDGTALLENRTPSQNHWLQFQLIGVQSERDAIGAKVSIVSESGTQMSIVSSGDGYQGKNESVVSFGLGENGGSKQRTITLSVHWPSGNSSVHTINEIDTRYLVVEGQTMQ